MAALARENKHQADEQTSKYTTPCGPTLPIGAYPDIASPH